MLAPLIPLIMYGWIPLTIYFFINYPAHRAVIISFIVATLFLPQINLFLPGNIILNKDSAAALGCFIGAFIYDSNRITSFQPGWVDIPIILWCFARIPSEITNSLSPISPILNVIVGWFLPYFLGRIYLNNLKTLKDLAIGIVMGGMAYTPLCLWEGKAAPLLHLQIYGFLVRTDFAQNIRYGGFRPTVFMEHGLAVGMWMMAVALVAFWLWHTKAVKKIWNIPMSVIVPVQIFILIWCRSTGAYAYMVFGVVILLIGKFLRTGLGLLILILIVCNYVGLAANGSLYNIPAVTNFISGAKDERSGSVAFRMNNERKLSVRARERALFGWGGSGNHMIRDGQGRITTITDSLWIIAFAMNGSLGLIGFVSLFILPAWGFFWLRYPARTWSNPKVAPVASIGVVLALFMLDASLNAFPNAIFTLSSGGISGMLMLPPENLNPSNRKFTPKAVKPNVVRKRLPMNN